jgi:BirA family biotin operon repressor/biotin-[acetyl-CoA-carboxylase] ligase
MKRNHTIIGQNMIVLDSVDSTNIYAASLLAHNQPPEGTIITARNQFKGRGQDTNTWESEDGKNITISVILYPVFLPIERQFQLNKAIALALFDFTNRYFPSSISIKWPNDIYIDDRKVAGLLINHSILGDKFLHSVIGIGFNINQMDFVSDAPNPVSLKMVTGQEYNLNSCLKNLCEDLNIRYDQLRNKEYHLLDEDYQNKLYRYGSILPFRHDGRIIHAKITGVDEYGRLMLMTSGGEKLTCQQKEIEYIANLKG